MIYLQRSEVKLHGSIAQVQQNNLNQSLQIKDQEL